VRFHDVMLRHKDDCSVCVCVLCMHYITRIVELRNAYKVLVGKGGGNRPVRRLSCTWKDYIKKGSYRNWMRRLGLDSTDSGNGPVVVSCEHGNETSGFLKGEEFFLAS